MGSAFNDEIERIFARSCGAPLLAVASLILAAILVFQNAGTAFTCGDCEGSGECAECKGEGVSPDWMDWGDCNECDGAKTCSTCSGGGKGWLNR